MRIDVARWQVVGPVALLCTLAGCRPDPVAALAAELEAAPGVAPRLSIASSPRACTERVPDGGTIPRADCPALRTSRPGRLSRLVGEVKGLDDPAAAKTLAVAYLSMQDERGIALDESIQILRELADTAERPAPVLADLAAALLVRAERTQAPRDLLEAYETAGLALRREPGNRAALYNAALALERFGLVDEAARGWDAYLAADSTSGWADEARRRKRVLASLAPAPRPADDAPLSDYARYAAVEPQGARELGMNLLLAEWAEAVEAGDAERAEDRLRRAGALGEALERRPGGDASLADAVRAVRAAAANAAVTRALARAHREYALGRAHFDAVGWKSALPRFAAAEAASAASPALRGWARVHLGTILVRQDDRDAGERILREVAAGPVRYPALTARAQWSLGNTLAEDERWEQGLEQALESARRFARAGERENEAAALMVGAQGWFVLGEPDSGYAAVHRALDRLRPYRGSVRLHTLLVATARTAAEDGLLRSAIRLQGEGVGVATRSGLPAFAAEARLARANLLAAGGDLRRALADVDTARLLVGGIDDEDTRAWLGADLHESEAAASRRSDPARAARALDSTAAHFDRIGVPFRVLPALVGSAEARLVGGDPAGAVQQLEKAIRLLDRRRDSIRIEPRRAAVFDAARGVVDRLVMLKLAEGRVAEALDYMDRGRASLATTGRAAGTNGGVGAPPGEVAVEYALVADTLLAWTVRGREVELFRTAIDTVRLVRTLAELEEKLEEPAGEEAVRPALSELHELLVRPLEARLGPAGTPLVVIADGDLAAVPLSALYDARRGRYLVEDHPLRFAVSLREARRRPDGRAADGALFVADPAFDRREHQRLDRLAHAGEEVRRAAVGYPVAAKLEGPGATRPALEAALSRAGMLHFAGHAVFDDERPERSYLVLAPSGREGGGRVTAAELSRLDLRHVRLVVLAACRTVRSGRSRAGGFSGLSGALLAAGAGGAVGSTWDVDDQRTAALMAAFHDHYRRSRDGPGALRAAQLALLRSGKPALRTPAAWAGFRYVGR